MKAWGLATLLAGLLLMLSAVTASAQGPVRSETLYAGAYRLRVDLYTDPPFTGRRYDFDVLVSADQPAYTRGVVVTASAIPEAGTNATEVPARLMPAPSSAAGFKGSVTMGVRGWWKLHFIVSGPMGTNGTDLPVDVAAPTEIPVELAWAIALSPLLFLLSFGWRQRANLRRMQSAPAT